MKVRLLNDGGYGDMENVKFPVIVDGFYDDLYGGAVIDVPVSELNKRGAKLMVDGFLYFSVVQGECEVVEDES